MNEFTNIDFCTEDGVSIIKINRPQERNRINRDTMREIISGLATSDKDPKIRSVIITGEGEYFCAGGQVDSFPDGNIMEQREFAAAFIDMNREIYRLSKPVIAAVQGHALAGGLSLVEACDIAIAGRNCQFGLPELTFGLFPMLALAVMEKGLPKKKVFELIYTGEAISAEIAKEWSLINEVVDQDNVVSTAVSYGKKISEMSAVAISFGREAFYKMINMTSDSAIEYGKNALLGLLWTEDAREASRAMSEGRTPRWKSR